MKETSRNSGPQGLSKAFARDCLYICLYHPISNYIYSVYAIVCYWELLTSTTVTARCPQSELSLDASRWPKRNRRSGKACQPSRKSLRLRDIARQNTSQIVWHKPDPIHAYFTLRMSRISQPLDLSAYAFCSSSKYQAVEQEQAWWHPRSAW